MCNFAAAKFWKPMKNKVFFLLATVVVLCACKGGEEPRVKTAEATITPEAGVYTLSNGVQIVVPEGAVSENTTIRATYSEDLDETTGPLPSDVQGVVSFGPEGTVFNRPLRVSMPLNQPVEATNIDIFYWSPDSARWYLTDVGECDGNKVTFCVDHFSTYAAMTGGWSDFFSQMDAAVGDKTSEEAISEAVKSVLKDLYDKEFDGYHFATRVSMGGQAVSICAEACGIFGFWMEEKNGVTRLGGGTYKEKSKHNIITSIGYSDAYASSHLSNASQGNISRTLELYGEPCATELVGAAKESKIEKGKTTEVTIHAHCGEEALADQLIQLSYSPELSCDVVNKKTDSNGEIKITVRGKEEGKGIVYAKAVSAVDADLVTEIQIPVKVGGGDTWEVEWRLPVRTSSRVVYPDSYDEGLGESIAIYESVRSYTYSSAPKTISFTIVGYARFKEAGNEYIPEAKMEMPVIKGTSYIGIEEGSVSIDYPEFSSSWEYWSSDGEKMETVEEYKWTYDINYRIIKWPVHEFTEVAWLQYSNRITIPFYKGSDVQTLLKDSIMYTNTRKGETYWTDYYGVVHAEPYSQTVGPIRATSVLDNIWPSSLGIRLEEGTFPLYHEGNTEYDVDMVNDNHILFVFNHYADNFYAEMELPYRGCYPKTEYTLDGVGEITMRRVEEDEQ